MNTSLGLLQSVGIGFVAIVLVAVVVGIFTILTSAVTKAFVRLPLPW